MRQYRGNRIGNPVIDADGDKSIIIVPRANTKLSSKDVEQAGEVIASADVLLLQLEVPIPASLRAAGIARASSTKMLLSVDTSEDLGRVHTSVP